MNNMVVPSLLAAVVAAAVSVLVARMSPAAPPPEASTASPAALSANSFMTLLATYKKNPPATTITLYKEDGECKAEVDSDPVGNLPEKRVFWYVLNDSCDLKEAHPKIKLVFTPNANGKYPFKDKEVTSKRQNDLVYVHEKIKKVGAHATDETEYDTYKYAVYLLNGTSTDPNTPILDPDLEVEEGNRNVTMGQKPAGAAPAPAPPVKKQ